MTRIPRLLGPGLALLAAATGLRADTTYNVATATGSGITIKLTTPLTSLPRFGFMPVRVFIENNSERDAAWNFHFVSGSAREFPGEVTGDLEVTVASRQNREAWYFLPIAQPGIMTNDVNLATVGTVAGGGGRGGGANGLPQIPGVVPAPRGLQAQNVRVVGSRVVNNVQETTFQIQQTGAASVLPVLPQSALPPRTTMSVTAPNLTGMVTRTTIITVEGPVPISASSNPAANAVSMVMNIGRQRLSSLGVPNFRSMQQSSEVTASATPGMMEVKAIFRTQGAPAQLVIPSRIVLPPSFTVSITPVGRSGQVERVITYTETLPIPPGYTPPTAGTAPGAAAPTVVAAARGVTGPNFGITAEISGPGLNQMARQSLAGSLANGQSATPPMALSPAVDPVVRGQFVFGGGPPALLTLVDPVTVPADWRLWSSFHTVVFTESEFSALDAARLAALRGWVALGGNLVLTGTAESPVREEKLGAGLTRWVPDLSGRTMAEIAPLLRLELASSGLPERSQLDLKDTTLGLEVTDTGSSATWLITFLLLFAGLIGPVNLWVFARGHHRHRLFWTTPALSLAGGLVLALVILVQDGLGGEGQRAAIVVLVPGQNQAAIFQEQAARTGYLTQRAFNLSDDVLLANLVVEGITAPLRSQSRTPGRAEGDWFMNRSRQAHLLRQLVPNRGRIEQVGTAADGAPIIESSLAVELKSFVFVDDRNRRWTAPEVLPGKAVTLTPAAETARLSAALLGGSPAFGQILQAVTADTSGRWMAYGGSSALAPIETLATITWKESRVAYTGVAESGVPAPGGAR
jgi:hypothetical protein